MNKINTFLIFFTFVFSGCIDKNDLEVVIDRDYLVKANGTFITIFYQENFIYSCMGRAESLRVYFSDCTLIDVNGTSKKNLKLVSSKDDKEGVAVKMQDDGMLLIKQGSRLKVIK